MTLPQDVEDLVSELESLGARLWEEDGKLRFRAPKGVMNEQRRALLRDHREAVLAHVRDGSVPRLVADRANRFEPFPLTEVQAAYLLGRQRSFAYGGIGCHGYGELTFPDLDPQRMTAVWRTLIERHDMLRAIVHADGSQQVLERTPPFEVGVRDVRGQGPEAAARALAAVRAELDHRLYQPDGWPFFDVQITRTEESAVLHLSIDFLIADFVSIQILLREMRRLYAEPQQGLPELEISFRDCLLAQRQARRRAAQERDHSYWLARIDELPPAPELPVFGDRALGDGAVRFRRKQAHLGPWEWDALCALARRWQVSVNTLVLGAFAETIGRWSRRPRFTLDVTLLDRPPLHPQVDQVVGDFTAVELLAIDTGPAVPLRDRVRRLHQQLWQDLDHRGCSGITVLREIGRRAGADAALFPVVFTSAIGLGAIATPDMDLPDDHGVLGYGISQTPQVWIDCQNLERDGGLATNWDVRDGVLPESVVDDMFDAYVALLRGLPADPALGDERVPVSLPPAQRERRAAVNDTARPVPTGLLHDRVVDAAVATPDRVAVYAADGELRYGELLARANAVASRLIAEGVRRSDSVAIMLARRQDQVVAVLAVLLAGAAYVPIDVGQPQPRRDMILDTAGVRVVLTDEMRRDTDWPAGVRILDIDRIEPGESIVAVAVSPEAPAYTIFTSGSTGVPKGVRMSHRSVLNTVQAINDMAGIGSADRVLALSQLGFDLSVYDIFGPLAVGGAMVVPATERRTDPSHWAELVADHGVTVWNSVPAQLHMLHDYLAGMPRPLPTLRLALLSGDWIPVTLPDQMRALLPQLRLIGMGGATEAAIWSIYYPIDRVSPDWRSIPYGTPLPNQTFHVLDTELRDCPDWTVGELYIGGVGLAEGYVGDELRTAERFLHHPRTGLRLYRTGDLGRYLPSGDIEFLGREDQQVKIRGHRIELGEVETILLEQDLLGGAVVVASERHGARHLTAFVEPARIDRPQRHSDLAKELALVSLRMGVDVFAGRDLGRYREYTGQLDHGALLTMMHALRECGLFTAASDRHTVAEVLRIGGIAARHERLIRRWLQALAAERMLLEEPVGRYRTAGTAPEWAAAALAEPDGGLGAQWQRARELAGPDDAEVLDYFQASADKLPQLLAGAADPLALLFPEGSADLTRRLYEETAFNRWANATVARVLRAIAERDLGSGPLRVLEIGAGAGGTTAAILDALDDFRGGVELHYTDLSPFFLTMGKQRFADRAGLHFAKYDLDDDYRPQGFTPNTFDMIVAGDVLHAVRDRGRVLDRIRELLRPSGWLLFSEMTRDHYQIMTSLELLVRPGDATTSDRVFLDADAWSAALGAAGSDTVYCLPDQNRPDERDIADVPTILRELGICVFAAQFKNDRAAVDPGELRQDLLGKLPDYMVPPVIQVVDALPLSANGKIDRATLLAWLSSNRPVDNTDSVATPADGELERQLAAMWAESLGIPEVGRTANLFRLGGDSLVAAQIAGRIRTEVAIAADVFFDELLRRLLEQPTVAAVAEYLSVVAADTRAEAVEPPGTTGGVELVSLSADGSAGPATFLFPSGTGALCGGLVARADAIGNLQGLRPGPIGELGQVAADYAAAVAEVSDGPVRIVGYGLGSLLAVETAKAFLEAGGAVDRLVLVAGYQLPAPVEDELLLEYLYTLEVGADPGQIGLPEPRAVRELVGADGSLAAADPAGFGARSPRQRRADLARVSGADDSLEYFRRLQRVLAEYPPSLYAGDIDLVVPAAEWPSGGEWSLDFWAGRCLGDVRLEQVPCGHAACLRGNATDAVVRLLVDGRS
ncbi:amino acid adenylation domain-containing protein [Nocardia sp. NPDC051321]|uniref:amino acid adenylation domain-containing protein n=1 Tax=Nocardia sp. NPDC051321 TaxID=3364323 RepID=UPI0037B92D8C